MECYDDVGAGGVGIHLRGLYDATVDGSLLELQRSRRGGDDSLDDAHRLCDSINFDDAYGMGGVLKLQVMDLLQAQVTCEVRSNGESGGE